jgi:hypothetical protein
VIEPESEGAREGLRRGGRWGGCIDERVALLSLAFSRGVGPGRLGIRVFVGIWTSGMGCPKTLR